MGPSQGCRVSTHLLTAKVKSRNLLRSMGFSRAAPDFMASQICRKNEKGIRSGLLVPLASRYSSSLPLLSNTEVAHYLSLPPSHCLSSSLAPSLSAGESTWHLPSGVLSTEEASRHSHPRDAHQRGFATACWVPGMPWLRK